MYCCASSSDTFLKVTHFVFEKGENPKKYLENKRLGTKTRPVPITFDQVLREVMQCDSKNI